MIRYKYARYAENKINPFHLDNTINRGIINITNNSNAMPSMTKRSNCTASGFTGIGLIREVMPSTNPILNRFEPDIKQV